MGGHVKDPSAQDIRTERVTWSEAIRHGASWRDLSLAAATPNIFNDPGFAVPAAEALGAESTLQVMLAWRGDRELVGFMPFRRVNRWRVPFPVVEVWSHAYAPACLPLVHGSCAEEATIALFDAVTRDASLPGIVFLPLLSLDTAFAAALLSVRKPLYVHAGHQRAVADADLDGDAYVTASIRSARRKKLRQQRAAFAREAGDIAFAMATAPEEVTDALVAFMSLEASGWKGQGGTALESDAASRVLAGQSVAALADRGLVRILTMSVAGSPVASVIGFVASGSAWLWKIAYDEAHARHSPGKHVMMEMIRQLLDEQPGLFIDSCAVPDHPLADLLLGERMAMGDVVVSAGGRAGPAFRTANLLERLRGLARRLRNRLRG